MSFTRIKETFLRLPKHNQLIGVGGLVLAVSTLMPWYADLDSYKIGDQFLGITGPASFVGIAILGLTGVSLWIFTHHLLERRAPRLPVREAILHMFVSAESAFLLLIVVSIFMHPKFGVNITLKEFRFGMTFAFIGAVIMFIGAFIQNKKEREKDNDVGHIEPLIKMEQTRERPIATPQERPAYRMPQPSTVSSLHSQESRRLYTRPSEHARPSGVPESAAAKPEDAGKSKEENKSDSGSYMMRMDI